ncbi:MAG: hypothetical protein JWM78_1572 [Verrucomicrobiaceae bacterium]|nr:hypothetical protein [Verrucomicrobiaceae bacterium]
MGRTLKKRGHRTKKLRHPPKKLRRRSSWMGRTPKKRGQRSKKTRHPCLEVGVAGWEEGSRSDEVRFADRKSAALVDKRHSV